MNKENRQLLILDRQFNVKKLGIVSTVPTIFDTISPQKTTLELLKDESVDIGNIISIKKYDTQEFLGIVQDVSVKNKTELYVYPFINAFNCECTMESISGSVYDWIVATMEANFVNIVDNSLKLHLEFRNMMTLQPSLSYIFSDGNLFEALKKIFYITGVYLEFSLKFVNGIATAIYCDIYNTNDYPLITVRYDNPLLGEEKPVIENSMNYGTNKIILKPEEGASGSTYAFYLLEDNTVTTNQGASGRLTPVNQKIARYAEGTSAEELQLIAEKELLGEAYDHNIYFKIIKNDSYQFALYRKVKFITEDRTYVSYCSKIDKTQDNVLGITLGVIRNNLTDKVKELEAQTSSLSSATSAGSGAIIPVLNWGNIGGSINNQADLRNALAGKIPTTEKGAVNGVATLGADGKLTSTQMPAIRVTDVYVVASQAEMLALEADEGDVAKRTDLGKSFILSNDLPSILSSWLPMTDDYEPIGAVSTHNLSETAHSTLFGGKVDKVAGKGLSTNDLTGELKTAYDGAVTDKHTHSNKAVLDSTTASYTTAEATKLSGIDANAEVNVIETVKVNGTALTPSAKAVDVTVPTKTSQLTNDSGFSQEIWDGTIATSFAGGTGTEADPYLIGNGSELAYLANGINNGTITGIKFYKLIKDIILNENSQDYTTWGTTPPANTWTAIGNMTNIFSGVFDCNNHTIYGLYINNTSDYQGLFGASIISTIKDLRLTNFYIKSNDNVGGIIGGGESNYISNCKSIGIVIGNDNVGGVTGINIGGANLNCENISNVSGISNIGGIIGENRWTFTNNCRNVGTISGTTNVGGIAGSNTISGTIKNCYNLSSTAVSGTTNVGELVGENSSTIKTNPAGDLPNIEYSYYFAGRTPIGLQSGTTSNIVSFNLVDSVWTLATPITIDGKEYSIFLEALNAWVYYNQKTPNWIFEYCLWEFPMTLVTTYALPTIRQLAKTSDIPSLLNYVTKDGEETLTNKTLTSPIISTISNTGILTLPTSTGTLALTSQIPAKLDDLTRINKQGYISSGNQYFELATLPIDNSGNYASVILSGRIGGWVGTANVAYFTALISNRSNYTGNNITASIEMLGKFEGALPIATIVAYKQANLSTKLYIKVASYYTYDFAFQKYQSTVTYDYTGTAVTPTGTLIWDMASAPKFAVDTTGQISNGTYNYTLPSATGTLALTSQIPSVSDFLVASNIKAGTNITLSVSGKDVTINSTGGATVTVVDNLTSTSTTSALSANQGKVLNDNKVPNTRTVAGKALSENITLASTDLTDTANIATVSQLATKAVQPYIQRSYSGGNGVRLIGTYNYSTSVGDTRPLFYMAGKQGHGNGTSYLWQGEFIFGVSTTGVVTAKAILKVSDGTYGKFYYRHDTTNKILYLYIYTGQYSSAYFSDLIQINAGNYSSYFTLSPAGSVTTDTIVEGVNILYPASGGTLALTSQIPTNSTYVDKTTTQTISGAKTFSADLTLSQKLYVGSMQTIYNAEAENGFTGSLFFGNGGGSLSHTAGYDGYYNTANGFNALLSNTTGNRNAANGANALGNNTTGNLNTANGFNALCENTTGSNNVADGADAGAVIANGLTRNTITNKSVYIGDYTKSLADNQTNQIVIGYNTTGHGSNTATIGNGDITDNYFSGNVKSNGTNLAKVDASNITASSWISALLTGAAGYGDKIVSISLGTTGYIKYVSGLIIQWGSISGSYAVTATLPIAMTSTNYRVMVTPEYSSNQRLYAPHLVSKTTSSMVIYLDDSRSVARNYFVVGY